MVFTNRKLVKMSGKSKISGQLFLNKNMINGRANPGLWTGSPVPLTLPHPTTRSITMLH